MREIKLSKGLIAFVDDEDFERLSQFEWCASFSSKRIYAQRHITKNGRKTTVSMHREVMNAKKGEEIDHRFGLGLNNQKWNLRRCTRTQNLGNQKRRIDNTSGKKGVGRFGRKWRGRVFFKGTEHYKIFKTFEAAAAWRDAKAIELFGEFANAA